MRLLLVTFYAETQEEENKKKKNIHTHSNKKNQIIRYVLSLGEMEMTKASYHTYTNKYTMQSLFSQNISFNVDNKMNQIIKQWPKTIVPSSIAQHHSTLSLGNARNYVF